MADENKITETVETVEVEMTEEMDKELGSMGKGDDA